MSRYYLRYTVPYFYRTEYKGPKDSLTLMGQPDVAGQSSVQAIIRKGPDGYTWEIFMLCDLGSEDRGNHVLITVARSKKAFVTQHGAARDADTYIGNHHHISVLSGDPKPAGETWIQRAHRLWKEWEAEIGVTTTP